MDQERRAASFVARIWLEPGLNGTRPWRGHIQHVQSSQETYFQDLRRMVQFLETVAGVPFPLETAQGEKERPGG